MEVEMERWKFFRHNDLAMPNSGMCADPHGDWVDADEAETAIAKLEDKLAEAQRELQEIRGVIGFPGAVALAEAGLTESLADVVRYTHRQWLEQTHNSNQRVIRAEAAVDAAQRERDAEKAENAELRADRERLEWLLRNERIYQPYLMNDVEYSRKLFTREHIDAARREETEHDRR